MSEYLGWHFNRNLRLAHGMDGEPIAVGVTHRVEGPVVPCVHGLHASRRAIDALSYADDTCTHVARVRLSGEIVAQDDKAAATERTYLAVMPVSPVLHEFACRCAEVALMLADIEDARCWQAIHVKREWLAGRATDADLRAAERAAERAAWSAANAASAARSAAWSAAWSAARSAAWSAADAARSAAWSAAWSAADAAWSAAWSAADAAESAAWAEMNDLLESMLFDAMELNA